MKLLVKITSLSFLFLAHNFSKAENTMDNNSPIVFYIPNKLGHPWQENAPADARYSFNAAVLNFLVYIDSGFNIIPGDLESYHWDRNKNYYVLKLRPGLHFTNGRSVTIQDLEFSLLRPFFAEKVNEGSMQLVNIMGADKIKPGTPYQSGLVTGVKILSQDSLAVVPSSPNPSFMYALARPNYSLVAREELNSDLLTWKKWPVGTGPYKVISENEEQKSYFLELTDLQHYPEAPKKILFEQLRTLKPDVTSRDSLAQHDKSYSTFKCIASIGARLFVFNYESKFGNNPDFRKALNLALNREEISQATDIYTLPLLELATPGVPGRLGMGNPFNIEEAKKLFHKVLGSEQNHIFKIPYSPDEDYLGFKYREIIKRQLDTAGFKVEFVLSKVHWHTFQGEFGESPFRMMLKRTDFYDPLLNFTMFKMGSPLKKSIPRDHHLDNLFREAEASTNRDILGKNMKKLSTYFAEHNIIVPIFEIPSIVYYNQDKIHSIGDQFSGGTLVPQNIKAF